jgi:tetratricopeptide (TPR) repeat protein
VRKALAILAVLTALAYPLHASAETQHLDRDIAILQKILKPHPDAELYYRLGDLYVQKGRQTGDITYFNLAGNSLNQALKLAPNLGAAHRHLAFVFYALHNFAGAVSEADQAIKLDPRDSYAYGVLGDAQLETGQYAAAKITYAQMIALRGDLYSYSRRSGLETICADNTAAIADLNRAIISGQQDGEPPEGIAWAQVTLAQDYFLMGKIDRAAMEGENALKTYPGYHRALAILGQVRAAQSRFQDAADFYTQAIAVIPLPEYAGALSDVYSKLGRQSDATKMRQLVGFIAHLNTLNRVLYNRVLVDYYADHDLEHQKAVELAETEYQTRRDIYGEDALAWALFRAGQFDAALPHSVSALRFNTVDARLYFHAGMIYAALHKNDQARAALQQGLSINPHFQPLLDEVAAQAYAALGGSMTTQYARSGASHP